MKVAILDENILRAINPVKVNDYLQRKGWIEQQVINNKAKLWVINSDQENEAQVFLPLRSDFSDFPIRMRELLETLEVVENRSQLKILNELTEGNALPINDTNRLAIETNREVVNLIFQFSHEYPNEASIAHLGAIFSSLQYVINAIGQIKDGKPPNKIIPNDVIAKTELNLVETFAGSFGTNLAAKVSEQNLFGDSLAGESINELLKLIRLGANREELQGKLLTLQNISASRYVKFLESLVDAGIIKLQLEWGSPAPNKGGRAEISFTTAEEVIEIIKDLELESRENYEVLVKVVMIHYETQKVTLQDIETGSKSTKYKCEITNSASSDVETVSSSQIYIANILKVTKLAPITGKKTYEYKLLGLRTCSEDELFSRVKESQLNLDL